MLFADPFVVDLLVASLMALLLTMLSADPFAEDRLDASLVAALLTMLFADPFAVDRLVASLVAALLTASSYLHRFVLAENEEGTVWSDRRSRLENCVAQKRREYED
jgi:hypothetical protein